MPKSESYRPRLANHCHRLDEDPGQPCHGPVRGGSDGTYRCEGHRDAGYAREWTRERRAEALAAEVPVGPRTGRFIGDAERYGWWKASEHLDAWCDRRVRVITAYVSRKVGDTGVVDDWKDGWPTVSWDDGSWTGIPLSHIERVG
jgi:hypothetical protein